LAPQAAQVKSRILPGKFNLFAFDSEAPNLFQEN